MKHFTISYSKCLLILPITLLITSAFINTGSAVKKEFISIEQLMTEGKLDVSISGLGGYQEECVAFTIKNLTGDSVLLRIEPGRRLHSEDTTMQDIFIVKHKNLTLPPFATITEKGYGFCCKSHHRSPGYASVFGIGTMAPENWQKLATVIDNGDFPVKAIQAAVWSLSNDHPISAITDENPANVDLLRRTVAKIKGVEVPWYTVLFEEATGENQLFSDKHRRLKGSIGYRVNSNAIVSILVKDRTGQVVQSLVKGSSKSSGSYMYDVDLSVSGWPKGEYIIYVYEDYSNLNKKVVFKL